MTNTTKGAYDYPINLSARLNPHDLLTFHLFGEANSTELLSSNRR